MVVNVSNNCLTVVGLVRRGQQTNKQQTNNLRIALSNWDSFSQTSSFLARSHLFTLQLAYLRAQDSTTFFWLFFQKHCQTFHDENILLILGSDPMSQISTEVSIFPPQLNQVFDPNSSTEIQFAAWCFRSFVRIVYPGHIFLISQSRLEFGAYFLKKDMETT